MTIKKIEKKKSESLTEDVEASLGTAQGNAGRDVGSDAAERAGVQTAVRSQHSQVAVVLIPARGVGDRLVVQSPVEDDHSATGHVAAESRLAALHHVLIHRCRVEVEYVFLDVVQCLHVHQRPRHTYTPVYFFICLLFAKNHQCDNHM